MKKYPVIRFMKVIQGVPCQWRIRHSIVEINKNASSFSDHLRIS
jgi:hypothetical protein